MGVCCQCSHLASQKRVRTRVFRRTQMLPPRRRRDKSSGLVYEHSFWDTATSYIVTLCICGPRRTVALVQLDIKDKTKGNLQTLMFHVLSCVEGFSNKAQSLFISSGSGLPQTPPPPDPGGGRETEEHSLRSYVWDPKRPQKSTTCTLT